MLGGTLYLPPLPLKKLYIETYKKRLEHRPMKPELQDIYELKTLLWDLRYEEVRQVKSSQWRMCNLKKTVKRLKNKQSIDPNGLVSDLFKPGVMGHDLAVGLLDLLNGIKSNLYIPENMRLATITTIFKNNKKSRLDLANDRGIFILPVVRKITDMMMYDVKYDDIDLAQTLEQERRPIL